MFGWIFGLIVKLVESFCNVISKLIGYLFLAAVIATVITAGAKIFTDSYELPTAIFVGAFCALIKLLINEVAVPLVHDQEKREKERRAREYDELFRKAGHPNRYDANRLN